MHNNIPHDDLVKKLQPPKEAKLSIILNSVGNGIMLGTAPFVVGKTIEGIATKWRVPRGLHIFDAFAMVAGVVWGLRSGQREFKRLQNYRETVSEQIVNLSEEVSAHTQNHPTETSAQSWAKKEAEKKEAAAEAQQSPSAQR